MRTNSGCGARGGGIRSRCGAALSLLLLTLLAGCATGGGRMPETTGDKSSAAGEVVVERPGDGRSGFVITEPSVLDAGMRRGFGDGVALLEEGRYEEAIERLEQVVAQAPGVTAPYIGLANACVQAGRPEAAEPHLRAALELVPGHPVASNAYGLLLRRSGRFDAARAVYEQALERFPEYLPVRRNLGILCDLYLDDLACALEHYEYLGAAVPGDDQVEIWIADLRLRLE